jgi:hypothetical protein
MAVRKPITTVIEIPPKRPTQQRTVERCSALPWGLKWLAPRLSAVAYRSIASGIGRDTQSAFVD